jgi:hypothetical protein
MEFLSLRPKICDKYIGNALPTGTLTGMLFSFNTVILTLELRYLPCKPGAKFLYLRNYIRFVCQPIREPGMSSSHVKRDVIDIKFVAVVPSMVRKQATYI